MFFCFAKPYRATHSSHHYFYMLWGVHVDIIHMSAVKKEDDSIVTSKAIPEQNATTIPRSENVSAHQKTSNGLTRRMEIPYQDWVHSFTSEGKNFSPHFFSQIAAGVLKSQAIFGRACWTVPGQNIQ